MSDFLNEYDGVTLDTHKKEPVIYTDFIKKFKKWLNKIATTNKIVSKTVFIFSPTSHHLFF